MNSTVTVRAVVRRADARRRVAALSSFWSPKPVTWQSTRYSGTSAKPKAKLPADEQPQLAASGGGSRAALRGRRVIRALRCTDIRMKPT